MRTSLVIAVILGLLLVVFWPSESADGLGDGLETPFDSNSVNSSEGGKPQTVDGQEGSDGARIEAGNGDEVNSEGNGEQAENKKWWENQDNYNAYFSLFQSMLAKHEKDVYSGPEEVMSTLVDKDNFIKAEGHVALTGIQWERLGEIDSANGVYLVLGVIEFMDQNRIVGNRRLHNEVERVAELRIDPFAYPPGDALFAVSGKEFELSIEQAKRLEGIYWARLGERARLERDYHRVVNVDHAVRGRLGFKTAIPKDSDYVPSQLAGVQSLVDEVTESYINDVIGFLNSEDFE